MLEHLFPNLGYNFGRLWDLQRWDLGSDERLLGQGSGLTVQIWS